MERLKKISIRRFIHNIYRLFAYDKVTFAKEVENELNCLREQITWLTNKNLVLELRVYALETDETFPYKEELNYLIENGFCNFPYKKMREIEVESGFDNEKKMPYVLHKGKRLYFPQDWTEGNASRFYKDYIENECILGGEFKAKAPHCYQSSDFKIERGDVLVDVGCAEALLSLDTIDIVSKAYLLECDEKWIPALEATFAPYKDKVIIINKHVGHVDSSTSVRLESVLESDSTIKYFIKMDIEGNEVDVLNDSMEFLKMNNTKIACCIYHRNDDAMVISQMLERNGYSIEYSDGVMLFNLLDTPKPPYFRKGVIRARAKLYDSKNVKVQ